jgi:nitronate monooxygenase/enoyl-[acyl-carrier protein] reductase II
VQTPLCERLGIEVPVIQGSLGPWSSVALAAAVSESGGLGTLGTALLSADQIRADIRRLRELTDRPFAVNHTMRPLSEEAWEATLEEAPPVVSFALGDPGDRVAQAHEAGSKFVFQGHTVQQVRRAVELGVDVVVAQGTEAGGFGGWVSTLALVPQAVEAAGDIPVAAAGGVADGRGFAAVLALGASGINIGTRFVASTEAEVADDWKGAIVEAESEDAVKALFAPSVLPPPTPGGFSDVVPRVLHTPFVDRWNRDPEAAALEAPRLGQEIVTAIRAGRGHEYVPFTGQTAGLIREVLPVAEIMRRLVADAEAALDAARRVFD